MMVLDTHVAAQLPGEGPLFERIMSLEGQVFRCMDGRRTVRVQLGAEAYFLKAHHGVGWGEIIKNLLQLRLPVLGARNEWEAIHKLEELGIETLSLVGYGARGRNPATLQSFVMTRELTQVLSLEDFCAAWRHDPPRRGPALIVKRRLIRRVAEIARRLHDNGIIHRDLYLCHFLLRTDSVDFTSGSGALRLVLIDLHRAGSRYRPLQRWVLKDLAALHFSTMDLQLTTRDRLRFLACYFDAPLRTVLQAQSQLLRAVQRRGLELYAKDLRKNETLEDWILPCSLPLPGTSPVQIQVCIRHLRGRRLVGRGLWSGQAVFIKLYIDRSCARRHWAREHRGLQALRERQVPTADCLYSGATCLPGVYVVLTRYLEPAPDALALWDRCDHHQQQAQLLTQLVDCVAQHHRQGIFQDDIHLGNFLLYQNRMLTVDGADVRVRRAPLSVGESLNNLGWLFAQLAPAWDAEVPDLFERYCEQLGRPLERYIVALQRAVERNRKQRLRDYLRKCYRTCSAFVANRTFRHFHVYDRSFQSEQLSALIAAPDRSLGKTGSQLLKRGNTCTVWMAVVDGHALVVKRYNLKNWAHGAGRAFRRTRASISWENAHRLQFLGVKTPRPVALVEERIGWIRRRAYFITTCTSGRDALSFFSDASVSEDARQRTARSLRSLLAELAALRLGHGDLKASNVIVGAAGPELIDLDAMRAYRRRTSAHRAHLRDCRRFRRNWDDALWNTYFAGSSDSHG